MTEYLYKPYTNKQYADFVVKNKGRKLCKDDEKVWFEDYPQPSLEELKTAKRAERDALLLATDKYMISDYPITNEERESYKQYRQYLRDLPESKDFPNIKILSYEEFK